MSAMFKQRFSNELRNLKSSLPCFLSSQSQNFSGSENPQSERLLESLAFVSARVAEILDGSESDHLQTLLSLRMPHALAPMPAMTVVAPEWDTDECAESMHVLAGDRVDRSWEDTSAQESWRSSHDACLHPIRMANFRICEASGQKTLWLDLEAAPDWDPSQLEDGPLSMLPWMDGDLNRAGILAEIINRPAVVQIGKSHQILATPLWSAEDTRGGLWGRNHDFIDCIGRLHEGLHFPWGELFLRFDLSDLCSDTAWNGKIWRASMGWSVPSHCDLKALMAVKAPFLINAMPVAAVVSQTCEPMPARDVLGEYSLRPAETSQAHMPVIDVDRVWAHTRGQSPWEISWGGDVADPDIGISYILRRSHGLPPMGHDVHMALVGGDATWDWADRHFIGAQLTCGFEPCTSLDAAWHWEGASGSWSTWQAHLPIEPMRMPCLSTARLMRLVQHDLASLVSLQDAKGLRRWVDAHHAGDARSVTWTQSLIDFSPEDDESLAFALLGSQGLQAPWDTSSILGIDAQICGGEGVAWLWRRMLAQLFQQGCALGKTTKPKPESELENICIQPKASFGFAELPSEYGMMR